MEIKNYLEEHYKSYSEDERLESKHDSVELLTTLKYIYKYLKKGMRILEIGAATGKYSLHFAEEGYQVNAVDLIGHNLDILKSKIKPEYNIIVNQGNALDLNMYEDNTFDITLVLGPIYHLYTMEDKKRAVSEALRVTKKGGIIYLAYLTNDSVIIDYELLDKNLVEDRKKGLISKNFRCESIPELIFSMDYVSEFDDMMSHFNLEPLHTVATDGMTHHFKDKIDEMDDEFFKAWLDYHYSTCERKDLMGYSNHVLYIGRKL